MKPRMFVSAVTSELGQTRQLVANVLSRLGYDPVWQDIFGTEPGDLRQVLRDKIDDCQGLIQIVGHGYGTEPPDVDPQFGCVSYTQFEFLYAQSRGKRTWLIFAEDGCTRDRPLDQLDLPQDAPADTASRVARPESSMGVVAESITPITPIEDSGRATHCDPVAYQAERRELQQAWRNRWKQHKHLTDEAKNDTDLELKVECLNNEFGKLRRAFRYWHVAIMLLLVLVAVGVCWIFFRPQFEGIEPGLLRKEWGNSNEEMHQRDLSISYDNIGDAQLQSGQVSEALASYQQSLEIRQKLAAADPSDAQAQRDLSVSYNKVGDGQLRSGQLSEALASYQQSLEIRQKLAAVDPSDAQAQRDLSVSYNRIGNVQLQSGQVSEALASYQQFLEISRKLAAADPSDSQAQRDLSVSYEKIGDVQLQSGQVSEALASYQKSLEISQKLAAADPSDAQGQIDFVVSIVKIGSVYQEQKQYKPAIETFDRALTVLVTLKGQNRLPAVNEQWIGIIERAIQECRKLMDGAIE